MDLETRKGHEKTVITGRIRVMVKAHTFYQIPDRWRRNHGPRAQPEGLTAEIAKDEQISVDFRKLPVRCASAVFSS